MNTKRMASGAVALGISVAAVVGLAGVAQAAEPTPGAKPLQWDLTLTREETKRAASGDVWAASQYCSEVAAKIGAYWAGASGTAAAVAVVTGPLAVGIIPATAGAGGMIGGGTALANCTYKTIESARKAEAKGKRAGLTFQLPGLVWTWSY